MATIRGYIGANMPSTFAVLDTKYPNVAPVPPATEGTLGIIDMMTTRVLSEIFPSGITEDDLSEGSKTVIADIVSHYLIPPAIDHYQVESRLSEGVQGESVAYYDHIKALQELDARLVTRIRENAHLLDNFDVQDSRPTSTPRVSSAANPVFHTTSPADFPSVTEIGKTSWAPQPVTK